MTELALVANQGVDRNEAMDVDVPTNGGPGKGATNGKRVKGATADGWQSDGDLLGA